MFGAVDGDLVGTAQATITNSTITNNTAELGNTPGLAGGSGIANFAIANISNSIIADNTNDDIAHNFTDQTISQLAAPVTVNNDVVGINNSNGHNIVGNGDNVSGFTDGTDNDQVGTKTQPIDPKLDTLKNNGRATQTHALLEGSPAINAGNNNKIAKDTADLDGDNDTSENIPFEQRGEGFARVVGDKVDIGAVESVTDSSNTNNIIINEILADPASGNDGDANGDGTREASEDEFIELINNSPNPVDISGWTLSDSVNVRHIFSENTIVAANGVVVVFGGGTPTGNFGEAIVQTASSGSIGLTLFCHFCERIKSG